METEKLDILKHTAKRNSGERPERSAALSDFDVNRPWGMKRRISLWFWCAFP